VALVLPALGYASSVEMYHQHRGWFRRQLLVPPA